jgi:hypothetical protein
MPVGGFNLPITIEHAAAGGVQGDALCGASGRERRVNTHATFRWRYGLFAHLILTREGV